MSPHQYAIPQLAHEDSEQVAKAILLLEELLANKLPTHQRPLAVRFIKGILKGQFDSLEALAHD